MRKRDIASLSLLGLILIVLGFFATPLMKHARALTWDGWVKVLAWTFRIRDIEVSQSTLDTITHLQSENIRLTAELAQYQKLTKQLGEVPFDTMKKIPAAIVARPSDTLESKYVINKGIAEGITSGAPVVIYGSTLLGFTTELSEHSSIVQTLFSPATSVAVETKDAKGLLKSQYQTSLVMSIIPRDATLVVGDPIVTTNKGVEIPYGMLIGTIAEVSKPEHEAYQSANIEVTYSLDSIDTVTVLTPR